MYEDAQQLLYNFGRNHKQRGQTKCNNCSKIYNNRRVPRYCSCLSYLGGQYTENEKQLDAKMLTEDIASIRKEYEIA